MQNLKPRPTSPHLSIWRWQIWAITSIIHRITGIALSVAGMLMVTWFLVSLSLGEKQYDIFVSFAASAFGQIILIGLSWTMFQHMASGIRNLVMDTGAGMHKQISRNTAIATFILSIIMTTSFWGYIWLK